ncbi:MAG: hypothetical protein J0H74_14515 [Chitinophagaceae bacterium]|nr:hypothetical protein [Chitinophagaceae bacterium]
MKRTLLILAAVAVYAASFAQTDDDEYGKQPSKESQAYHAYRTKITRPPYGLEKILALIKATKGDEEDNVALSPKTYEGLSFREKFTYNMVHGESYAQNCDAGFANINEEKKVYAVLPGAFEEEYWSSRQEKFFENNHDSVVALMTASIGRTHRVGVNFKRVIADINATEMIPLLISTYNIEKKDHDLLTVLMLLMLNNKYQPFLASVSYKKLYADKETRWKTYLNFNSANEALIIQRATDFYNGLPFAQKEEVFLPVNQSLLHYNDRRDISMPSYGLEKILALIEQARQKQTGMSTVLSPEIYSALPLREKFTYHMINGESYNQNCSGPVIIQDEEKKILAQLPDIFGDYGWSVRQWGFFKDNRDSVILFMTASAVSSTRIGANFKWVIERLNVTEMIPLLITTYRNSQKKDHDLLTVLTLLMQDNKYQPFLSSGIYQQLYESGGSRSRAYIDFNASNEAQIIQYATDFYGGLAKK